MALRKNDSAEVMITDMNDLGYGIGHIDGKAVFVRGGVTGDCLNVKIIKDAGSYYVALPEKTVFLSSRRRDSSCPYFPKCGGCSFSNVSYEYEKELKRGFVKSALNKERLFDLTVLETLSTGKITGYRNKVQFPCAEGRIGYYAAHSHRIASGTDCALHGAGMRRVLALLADFLKSEAIECYDENSGKGLLRHILLRGSVNGDLLLTLVLNGRTFPAQSALLALLQRECPEVKGLFYNVNTENTNVILGREFIHVYGDEVLTDALLGCTFELSPGAFYQVNHDACELLYREVAARADLKSGYTVADLFCGAGTIGITLVKDRPDVRLIGIECVPEAVRNAERNALRNGIRNAEFLCGDANHPALGSADVVIVDPPRKGLDAQLIPLLSSIKNLKKIVYVSCNPSTLARDLARFTNYNWSVGALQPVDMFPRTGHVETVVSLSKVKM